MATVACFLVSVVVSQYYNTLRKAGKQKIHLQQIGKLQFKGRVIHSKTYWYFGKNYYLVCVKLDSANVKSFYVYNNLDCLKIKDSIATFAAGYLNHTLGAVDSVAVNINNSGKIIFHYRATPGTNFPWGLIRWA